jgi:hypothetical protein
MDLSPYIYYNVAMILLIIIGLCVCGSAFATLKDSAYGIFSLTKVNSSKLNLDQEPSWTNPNITGVVIRAWWQYVNAAPQTFDWSHIDEGLALAQKYNKKIAITIVAGIHSPNWIYTSGAKQFTIQNVGVMPCPWDSVFQAYWQQFVLAFGARYNSHPELSYVTATGPGREEECYLCKSTADVQELNRDGGVQVWIQAAQTIAGYYAAAFPTTPFVFADGQPIPGDSQDYGTVVNYCVSTFGSQFGIKSDGLRPHYGTDGFGAIEIPALSATHPVGFQDYAPFESANLLQEALSFGISLKGHFIEVYHSDVTAPYDQTVIANAQKQLTGQ